MNDDWDSVTVLKKRQDHARAARTAGELNAARRAGAIVDTGKKYSGGKNASGHGTDGQLIAKVDRTDDIIAPKKVEQTVRLAIQKARQEKGLTQKALATAINEKPTVVNDYESGRGTPNPNILAKMERVLKVKLRGKNVGSPLGAPKKKN
ncbi:MAG: putative multi-protein binding factor 1 [Piptocephalis tieghemiana]|nr:MAG: putative multi-protein binding factor 1 [Piptocephalis tieghemiana]